MKRPVLGALAILLAGWGLAAQDEKPLRQIATDLESDDAAVRSAAVERFRGLDEKQRKRIKSAIGSAATRLARRVETAWKQRLQKILSGRPDPQSVRAQRVRIKALASRVEGPGPKFEDVRRQMTAAIKELWAAYYPDLSGLGKGPEVQAARTKLRDALECSRLAGLQTTVEQIDMFLAELDKEYGWELLLSARDAETMQKNRKLYENSRGGRKMDPEEYRFCEMLNLYRVMMGLPAIRIDLMHSADCREWSRGLVRDGGGLVHSSEPNECLARARSGEGAFWILTTDWPHHRVYFSAGRIGIGRDGSTWTFRG